MESHLENWSFWGPEESGQEAGAGDSTCGNGRYILAVVCPRGFINLTFKTVFAFFLWPVDLAVGHQGPGAELLWARSAHLGPPGLSLVVVVVVDDDVVLVSLSLRCLCFLFGPEQETDWQRILVCRGLFRGSQGTRPPLTSLVRIIPFSSLIGEKCQPEGSLWFTKNCQARKMRFLWQGQFYPELLTFL